MSDFSASIIARLDTSKIPGDIKDIEKRRILLGNFALDTRKLPSQIQASLDNHKFKINIDGLKIGNIDSEMKKMGSSASRSFSKSFSIYKELMSVQRQLNSANAKFIKLDPSKDVAQFRELSNQIQRLEGEYRKLYGAAKQKLSADQLKGLEGAINIVSDKLSVINAKLKDTASIKDASNSFNGLYNTAKKISSLKLSIAGLDDKVDSNQISRLNSQLKDLELTYNELSSKLSGKLSTEQLKKLSSIAEETENKIALLKAKMQDSLKPVSELDVAKFDNKLTDLLRKNTAAVKEFGGEVEAIRKRLHTLFSNGELTDIEFDKLKKELDDVEQRIIKSGKTGHTFFETFKNAFRSIINYVSVSSLIYGAANAAREMYRNVVDIDSAMTELKKVTNETDHAYSQFLSNASASAKEIGSTITDYINSTSYFARLGYSFGDSQELAKVANIYTVVGDEIKSNDEATKSLISTLTAFDVEAGNAISIVDKFNEVGKHNVPKDTVMYWDISLLVAISAKLQ